MTETSPAPSPKFIRCLNDRWVRTDQITSIYVTFGVGESYVVRIECDQYVDPIVGVTDTKKEAETVAQSLADDLAAGSVW